MPFILPGQFRAYRQAAPVIPPVDPPIVEPIVFDYTATPATYTGIVASAAVGEAVGLETGEYLEGLDVPAGVIVGAINGVGSVNFTGATYGLSYSNGIIRIAGNGSRIDGLIAHDPTDQGAHCIYTMGDNNIITNCGAYNGGTAVHKIPAFTGGSNNLFEDSFFFGEGRYSFQIFKASFNTIRRCVGRWDSTLPNQQTQPNATFSNYNANNTIWENNISLDYNYPGEIMNFGGDFYAPHNQGEWTEGNHDNQWLGCMVAYHDRTNDGGLNDNNQAFRADSTNPTNNNCLGNIVKDMYIRDTLHDFVVKPGIGVTITDFSRYLVTNPRDDGVFDAGRLVITDGLAADIDVKYIDGVKTAETLWPFVNEAVIRTEMKKVVGGNRGWAAGTQSLEDYVKGVPV